MAENVFLKLKASGVDIPGDSSQTTLDREGAIECTAFSAQVILPTNKASPAVVGRRRYEPITFTKPIDRSTPLLAKALTTNQPVEATFLFFGTDSSGQDTKIFTIDVTGAHVSSLREFVLQTQDPAFAARPAQEEVAIVFGQITWTWIDGGITHQDAWGSTTT